MAQIVTSQGHQDRQTKKESHLRSVRLQGPCRCPFLSHGTSWDLWDTLCPLCRSSPSHDLRPVTHTSGQERGMQGRVGAVAAEATVCPPTHSGDKAWLTSLRPGGPTARGSRSLPTWGRLPLTPVSPSQMLGQATPWQKTGATEMTSSSKT